MRNPFLVRRKKILFAGTPRRLLRNDGCWWDIYTDPIINLLKTSTVSIEYSFLFNHFKPPRTKNLRYFDFLDFLSHSMQVLRLTRLDFTQRENQLLTTLQEELKTRFGVEIDVLQRVKLVLEKRKARLPLYQILLRRIQPSFVVVVTSYGKEDFIEACKSLKIPVAELQHGVIHRFHLGYSYEGRNRNKVTYPDYLLSFGEYWKEGIEYPIPSERIIPVGFPLIDDQRTKFASIQRKNQIVFISQTTAGELLSKFAVELSKTKQLPFKIVYKLQPQECDIWKENYPWLIDSDVEVIDTKSDVLHKILAESKMQIGVSSTALYEGLAFGLRTFITDGPGVEYLDALVNSGIVQKIETSDDLLRLFEEEERIGSFDSEYFFKSGATRAIADFLEERIMKS